MTTRKLVRLPLFVTLAIAALPPAAASAASVELTGSSLTYTARAGETNNLTVTPSGASFVVRDPGAAITDRDGAGGCVIGPAGATCPGSRDHRGRGRLGDGDDQARITTPTADQIRGGAGADLLRSEAGADWLFGDEGDDTLQGGAGNDQLDGGADADVFSGGPGTADTANYRSRTEAVSVRIDNVADDGSAIDAGADDVRSDVERAAGGAGGDTLVGSPLANVLMGGVGDDVLRGLGGADELLGDSGVDRLLGADGDDVLLGHADGDQLSAGPGSRPRR